MTNESAAANTNISQICHFSSWSGFWFLSKLNCEKKSLSKTKNKTTFWNLSEAWGESSSSTLYTVYTISFLKLMKKSLLLVLKVSTIVVLLLMITINPDFEKCFQLGRAELVTLWHSWVPLEEWSSGNTPSHPLNWDHMAFVSDIIPFSVLVQPVGFDTCKFNEEEEKFKTWFIVAYVQFWVWFLGGFWKSGQAWGTTNYTVWNLWLLLAIHLISLVKLYSLATDRFCLVSFLRTDRFQPF